MENAGKINKVELVENLIENASKISYSNKDEFDILQKRVDMVIRKLFGDKSHYLEDFNNIRFVPGMYMSGVEYNMRKYFEDGMKEYRNLIQVVLEDVKLSTNYQDEKTTAEINLKNDRKMVTKNLREVVVLIASPTDAKIERELLMDKLETKFRREHYEEQCNARIIINGWEILASQTGYPQDVINNDLVRKSNIILAVFHHKLGSPTINPSTGEERSPSGTAEELLFAIKNKKIENSPLGMAYFYANAPIVSLDSIDKDKIEGEWKRLKEFREEISKAVLYKTFNSEDEILDIVCKDLCENIKKYFK